MMCSWERCMDNKAQIYCKDSGNLGKALGIDRFRLKRLRTNNGGEIFLQWLLLEKAQNKLICDDVISWMCLEKLKPADLMFIMDRMAPLQIKNYLEKQAAESGESVKNLIKTWKDYLNMAIRVGVNVQDSVIYRARKLMQRHNEMIKEIEAKDLILRAGELEKKYPGLNRICRDLKKYEYADKEYQIVVPEKVDDILYEAKLMHHCVNNTETYYERMSQQESYILFLRKTEQPTEAYYMWNRKCTPQEAIERAIEWKKAHEITYHGVKYPSLPQCCEELGINPISVRLYMEKNGVSSTRAITHYIKSKKQRIFAFRGKEYNSFTECCLAYGLNPKIVRSAAYRTKSSLPETLEKNVSHMEGCVPQESTGNDENSGNKVISKKRHRAKEPFFYEGEKYVSLGQCCEIYGINETSVRTRAWRIHCTWEEAVKHFIEKSNADELKKIFVYKGKEYQSVAECCRKYDVRAASVRNRASSTGCSIEEALDHFIKKKIVTKKNEFVFRNKIYETLEECCEVYGVNANSVSSRKYRLGCSTDESLEHFIANKEIIEERIQKFTFKGAEYPSLRACCKKYGIEDACVRQRARDKNCSIEESFEHFMTRKRKKMLDNPEFDYHGTLYPSLKECCEKLKISKNSVVSKSRRSGCSLQEAVEYYVKKQHNK